MGRSKPKRRTQRSNRLGPRRSPIVTVPTLLERARISEVVSVPPPPCASSIVRSATWIVGARLNEVWGVTRRCSSAPATVNGLNVDPGSYANWTARSVRA